MRKINLFISLFVVFFIFVLSSAGCVKQGHKKEPVKKTERKVERKTTEVKTQFNVYENTPRRKASDRIVEKGMLEFQSKKYEQALQLFQDAVNVDSSNGVAYYYLALTNIELDRKNAANGLLDKAEALLSHEPGWLEKIENVRKSIGTSDKAQYRSFSPLPSNEEF